MGTGDLPQALKQLLRAAILSLLALLPVVGGMGFTLFRAIAGGGSDWGALGITVVAMTLILVALFGTIRCGATLLQTRQRQLAEMDALAFMGEMATAVAHGLRNPLASIRSSAELALDADYEPVRKNARDIVTQVDFLSRWVRELLLFTQPVAGEPEPVDLAVVLGQVVESFAPACAKAGVRMLWTRKDAAGIRIEGNVSLVTQALHSVLSNAIEAMPAGGELRIAMAFQVDRQRFLLTIADTGVGMSEKQLALAFKPFHTTKRHGLGVGLAMVKRVMERFGGSVALSSREHEGTVVRLEFRMV
ncbi:MAG: putative two-component histidine kinase [Rhodocyclaceae bacterium]|nr:putative two-component histidine kinase [Rhodocyclaceae bacterium]